MTENVRVESLSSGAGDNQPRVAGEGPWLVLLVDDEPEIHEITKLVLANACVAGRPVALHSAYSGEEARVFMRQNPGTALVLLDVVMETDDAGLALVRYIRDQLRNPDVQIVLRTGQPGMAPEREVILQFDINGYFLKTEITAQKLYSITISSLRAFQFIKSLRGPERQRVGESASVRDVRRQAVEADFARAIENGELYLQAQPEVLLASDAVVGIEIVPSWKTGDGVLGLSQIAGTVQDPDLRLRFDQWLLRQACAWGQSWQSLRSPPLRVSVPVMTEHIWDCRLLSLVERHVAEFGLTQGTLDLEVPETMLLQAHPDARDALAFLQSQGVSATLVDFGSGLISLPLLQRLLPDRVKIHRSFVRNVSSDRERSAVARSIIALAHTLGLNVVADGIASEPDLQFFKWEDCELGQGDLLARSMAITDVANLLSAGKVITH